LNCQFKSLKCFFILLANLSESNTGTTIPLTLILPQNKLRLWKLTDRSQATQTRFSSFRTIASHACLRVLSELKPWFLRIIVANYINTDSIPHQVLNDKVQVQQPCCTITVVIHSFHNFTSLVNFITYYFWTETLWTLNEVKVLTLRWPLMCENDVPCSLNHSFAVWAKWILVLSSSSNGVNLDSDQNAVFQFKVSIAN